MNLSLFLTDSRKLVYVLGGAIAFVVFLTLIIILRNFIGSTGSTNVTLQFWGVYDSPAAFDQVVQGFQKLNKGITVQYRLIPYASYEQTLLNALAAGSGPDLFMIHNTWLPKDVDKLRPITQCQTAQGQPLMTVRQFQDTFVDVAARDLIRDNSIYGMPLYVDTMALFYNRDLLNSAGIATPPSTWADFQSAVQKLTAYDASRNITRAGAALGTARNVNRATDILMLLMLQSGVQMTSSDGSQATFATSVDGQPVGERSLQFYTDFANPQKQVYTWNDAQHYSIDAFNAGEVAMMLNYAHTLPIIREAAPRLNVGIARVPQASAADARTFANYWPVTVSGQSQHPCEAWAFINYLAAGEGTTAYLNAAARPSARKELIAQQKNDPSLGVFAEQALTARSWFQIDNGAIEAIFADMIDAVNYGKQSIRDALNAAEDKVSVLMASH